MSKNKKEKAPLASETNEFNSTSEVSAETAPAPEVTTAPAETPKRAKKPRTPIETRIANMFRGERAQYYSLHLTSLNKQIADLKTLVGAEAVELAEKEFLKA